MIPGSTVSHSLKRIRAAGCTGRCVRIGPQGQEMATLIFLADLTPTSRMGLPTRAPRSVWSVRLVTQAGRIGAKTTNKTVTACIFRTRGV